MASNLFANDKTEPSAETDPLLESSSADEVLERVQKPEEPPKPIIETLGNDTAIQTELGSQPTLDNPPEPPKKKVFTIFDLQNYMSKQTMEFKGSGDAKGQVDLINLNTNINSWYSLKVFWPHKKQEEWFHLQNINPEKQSLSINADFPAGIIIKEGDKEFRCNLWGLDGSELKLAKFKKKPFSLLCDDKIYLRNKIEGYRTTKEWVVEFLRDNVWGGETITEIVKSTIYKDRYLVDSEIHNQKAAGSASSQIIASQSMPS